MGKNKGEVESGGAAIWLASDAASFPNGHTLVGDGGARPGFAKINQNGVITARKTITAV